MFGVEEGGMYSSVDLGLFEIYGFYVGNSLCMLFFYS